MFYHILPLTDMLRSLLRPSPGRPTPNLHTVVFSDVRYSTHFYLTNTYVVIKTTVIPNIKWLVYYVRRFILTVTLFLLQDVSAIHSKEAT